MGHEFFGEKIVFPSTPVLSINNDQSLIKLNQIEFLQVYLGTSKRQTLRFNPVIPYNPALCLVSF